MSDENVKAWSKARALFEAAGTTAPMTSAELEKTWAAVSTRLPVAVPLGWLSKVLAGGAVLGLGTLLFALWPAASVDPVAGTSGLPVLPTLHASPAQPPIETRASKPEILIEPARTPRRMGKPAVKTVPAPEDSLLAESQLIAKAAQILRAQQNPEQALALLEEHAKTFSPPALADEARLLRIEALIAAQHTEQALTLLQKTDAPRTDTQRLVEAQLLAQLQQCGEALKKLEPLTVLTVSATVQEQALISRAACASVVGDFAGSQQALQHYLERFPSGRFAEQARQRLEVEVAQ